MKFHIISCGWFDSPYAASLCIQRNVNSVRDQTFERWNHYLVVDAGSEITPEEITSLIGDEREIGIMPDERRGMARNMYETGNMINGDPSEVLVFLDADDRFNLDTALSTIAIEYDDPECWVTHGSFKKVSGSPTHLNRKMQKKCSVRTQRWCMSHCKTCRLGLFKKLKADVFKDNSRKWLSVCSDLAMMFNLADMAGLDRVRYVPELIYEYNDLNPLNDHKTSREEQKRIDAFLRRKAPSRRLKSYV